jgi:pyruvate kinase
MSKHTKIVATVGPSSQDEIVLEQMIKAGVNVFRLNFSHGDYDYHKKSLENIKKVSKKLGLHIGILQDISGPKVRIGDLVHKVGLSEGDIIEFVKEKIIGDFVEANYLRVSLNHPEIIDKVKVKEQIFLYDGIICAEIVEVGDSFFKAKVLTGGILSPKKGVNFPNTRLELDIFTKKDIEDIKWGVENGVDFMAISFVQSSDDMIYAREIVKGFGGTQSLIAKIEKFEALESFDEILRVSDGIMVARGDLGIEVPYYRVPEIQKSLIQKCNEAGKPVITATQMLLSMTQADRATRAEISDVANAVLDGSDALMLSEESAIGDFPVETVETMTNTIKEAEKFYDYFKIGKLPYFDEMDVIDESAVNLVHNMDLEAILSITTSGGSAKKISRYRSSKPIYAITHDEKILRKLTLVWGVRPLFIIPAGCHLHETISIAIHEGIAREIFNLKSGYVLTAGDHAGRSGSTNTIKILRENEMRYYLEEFDRQNC